MIYSALRTGTTPKRWSTSPSTLNRCSLATTAKYHTINHYDHNIIYTHISPMWCNRYKSRQTCTSNSPLNYIIPCCFFWYTHIALATAEAVKPWCAMKWSKLHKGEARTIDSGFKLCSKFRCSPCLHPHILNLGIPKIINRNSQTQIWIHST